MASVIIADDEKNITDAYAIFLRRSGINDYRIYNDTREMVNELDAIDPSVFFLDLHMPYYSGEQLLEIVRNKHPQTPVLIITGNSDIETAVGCMRKGAFDYLVKPIDKERFRKAYESAVMPQQQPQPSKDDDGQTLFHGILTRNSAMKELFRYVESVGKSSYPVFITGETGTGKELFARAVHECSGRKGRFIAVNVSGLDDTMFSDTLFGHIKGAFTGADKPRNGLLAAAEGGTLFLDEIGDLNESAQLKLLRLLQEKNYMPLGSDTLHKTDARIVAATNADIMAKMADGILRKDLLYRLSTHRINIPALRERPCDIPILAAYFYSEALKDIGKTQSHPADAETFSVLADYVFPGNVRQLQAAMSDFAVVTASDNIQKKNLVKFMKDSGISASSHAKGRGQTNINIGQFPTLKEMEQGLVDKAVQESGGNISAAAKMLGITRQALHKRLKTGIKPTL